MLAETSPLLGQLADPHAANGLTFVLPDQIVDMAVYYSRAGALDKTISLTDDGESLRLQSPAPVHDILKLLQIQLLMATQNASPVMVEMPIVPAWLCWAFIDLLREASRAGDETADGGYEPETVMGVLGRPFQHFSNLAAYFREALELPLPLNAEVLAALNQLAGAGLVTQTVVGYQPGDFLREQAVEFSDVQAHLLIRTNALLVNGNPASMRNWIFQGKSGNGLLWHEVAGNVAFITLSRSQIITFVGSLLMDPLHFFAPSQQRPAPAHSIPQKPSSTLTEMTPPEKLGQTKPPAKTSRRLPPPEKL
jgi:hypothetical protein